MRTQTKPRGKLKTKNMREKNRERHRSNKNRHSIEQLNGIIISFKICFCTNFFLLSLILPECVCVRGANCYSFFLCVCSHSFDVFVVNRLWSSIRAAVCFSRFGQAT